MAKASTAAILLTGATQLNISLSSLGALGCRLLASPDVQLVAPTSPSGTASIPLAIPNLLQLLGLKFYQQYAIIDNFNKFGLVFSNGGQGTVGNQ